ncbi:hypothetical protein ACVIIW_000779 [Bradyrhizobium sp. USDA 4449]
MPMPPKAGQQLRRRRPGSSRTSDAHQGRFSGGPPPPLKPRQDADCGMSWPGAPALLFALTVPQARRDPAHAIASTVPRSRKSQRLLICRCGCGGCHRKRSCVRSQIPTNGLRWTSRHPSTPRWITIAAPGSACRGPEAHAKFYAIVESQIADAELPVRGTVERLMAEGIDRHEAIHAVGSVLRTDAGLISSSVRATLPPARCPARIRCGLFAGWRL